MSAGGVGKICFLKKCCCLSGCPRSFPYVVDKCENNELIFMYDLAPPYSTKTTKEWFKEERMPVLD